MSIARSLDRTMRKLGRSLHSPQITLGGSTYECIPNTLSRGDTLEVGGWQAEIALTVFIRKALLAVGPTCDSTLVSVDSDITVDGGATMPNPGKKASLNSRQFRIGRVSEDAARVFWRLDLIDPTK